MADLQMDLYKANKDIENGLPSLKYMEILDKIHLTILPFIQKSDNQYFMMLCREQYDFTLFNFTEGAEKSDKTLTQVQHDFFECFSNRGNVLDIELTEAEDAVEIWLRIDNEAYVYYFFPYDTGVIEVN